MSYFILERLLYYSTQTIGSLVNTAIQYKYGPYMGEEQKRYIVIEIHRRRMGLAFKQYIRV
jgi:hypothetical protein